VFKDAAQHRNRLKRMAEVVRRPFDEVTDDGTLVYGKAWCGETRLEDLGVPEEFYTVKTDHVELAWWLLAEMVEEGDVAEGEVVEQYPTVEGTVVERTPLEGDGEVAASVADGPGSRSESEPGSGSGVDADGGVVDPGVRSD
jgi:hypothetical protein